MSRSADHPLRIFLWSGIVSIVALVLGFVYGSWEGALLVLLLGAFEVSVSFDNAVVNARILEKMSEFWQKVFLTVGIAIAVFGMRILFPLVIVGVTTGLNPVEAWDLALRGGSIDTPGTYAHILHGAHPQIAAFGGMFLLMLFLDWVLDPERDIHWLKPIERFLAKIGRLTRTGGRGGTTNLPICRPRFWIPWGPWVGPGAPTAMAGNLRPSEPMPWTLGPMPRPWPMAPRGGGDISTLPWPRPP